MSENIMHLVLARPEGVEGAGGPGTKGLSLFWMPEKHFDHETGAYRVKRAVREQITFSRHNVLRDPPFSRLDLISCRNLLIYLEREVQAHVLEVFHFVLNPGALLFLGSAETAD